MKGYSLEDKAMTSIQNYGSNKYLKLIVTRFQRLYHVQPDLDILCGNASRKGKPHGGDSIMGKGGSQYVLTLC